MAKQTVVQWMRGESGTSGTYTFDPNPSSITRPYPGQRKAELVVPNLNGAIIQTYGQEPRRILVQGTIVVAPPNFDALMTKKTALEQGIDIYEGQLHFWSDSKHIFYKGVVDGQIEWGEQKSLSFLDYRFTILCGDPVEYAVSGYSGVKPV